MLSMTSSRPDWREGARSHYKASSSSYRSHSASSSVRRVTNNTDDPSSSGGWVSQFPSTSASFSSRPAAPSNPQLGSKFESKSGLSSSQNSLHSSMLRDLESSLKASSNYMESHRSVSRPGHSEEHHEYRSYSSSGQPAAANEFNLERQVQHMLPTNSNNDAHVAQKLSSSNLASSSVRSSTTQQESRYVSEHETAARPGSRLKQNIDELDHLLYDLNETRGQPPRVVQPDYSVTQTQKSDYSDQSLGNRQSEQQQQQSSSYEYSYQTSGPDLSTRKPPSPLGRRRPASPTGGGSRRISSDRRNEVNSYNYTSSSSSYIRQEQGNNNLPVVTTTSYHTVEPPRQPQPVVPQPVVAQPATPEPPKGVSYYSKYHSSHQQREEEQVLPPPAVVARPTTPVRVTQTPPRRVEELINEISEFDSQKTFDYGQPMREPSPERYRSGEPYVSIRKEPETGTLKSTDFTPLRNQRLVEKEKERPKAKKEKIVDKEGKKGAAVVPICLPLCCAAPCVIM